MKSTMKMIRKRVHMTQAQVSTAVGIHQAYYSSIESGKRKALPLKTAAKIANVLGCSLDEILSALAESVNDKF